MGVEWMKLCRLCGSSDNVVFPLCSENSFDILSNVNKYLCANLSISDDGQNSKYPQCACKPCAQFLWQINSFAMHCTKVQEMFENLVTHSKKSIKNLLVLSDVKIDENEFEPLSWIRPCNTLEVSLNEEIKSSLKRKRKTKKNENTSNNNTPRKRGRPRKCNLTSTPRSKLRTIQRRPKKDIDTTAIESMSDDDFHDGVSNLSVDDDSSDDNSEIKLGNIPANNNENVPANKNNENDSVKDETGSITDNDRSKTVEKENSTSDSDIKKKNRLKKSELKKMVPSLFDFKCHICEEVLKNWNSLYNHCKDKHNENPKLKCDCGDVLASRTAVFEHLVRHTDGGNLHKCDKCDKKFYRKSLLATHVLSHLPKEEQPFVCCKCARRFHCEALLKNHERVHLPKEERLIYPCNVCEKMFSSRSAVTAHQKAVHLKERPFVCDQCGHSFTSKGILQEHLTIHSDEYPYHCTECSKKFKTKYRLKVHLDTHQDTSYQCPKCPVQLSSRRTLRMHLVIHKDTKGYRCNICGKEFRRAKDLKNHNNLHTGKRPYTCQFCSRTFANGSNCRSHKRRRHPEELKLLEASMDKNGIDNVNNLPAITSSDISVTTNSNGDHSNVNLNLDKNNESVNLNDFSELPHQQNEQQNNHSSITNNYASTFLSFVNERRYVPTVPPPVRQIPNTVRLDNQVFPVEHYGHHYSSCQEQDNMAGYPMTAAAAYATNHYMHNQPFLYNRNKEAS